MKLFKIMSDNGVKEVDYNVSTETVKRLRWRALRIKWIIFKMWVKLFVVIKFEITKKYILEILRNKGAL